MNLKKTLPLLLAATLAAPAYAFDSSDPFGMGDAQVEKVAKAPREANGHSNGINLKEGAIAFGLGALGPLGAIGLPFVTISAANRAAVEMNAFYSGTVVRGKIKSIWDPSGKGELLLKSSHDHWGVGIDTEPAADTIGNQVFLLALDVDGPTDSVRAVLVRKDSGYEVGDIVDAKTALGTFAF
ncbi:MAG: hypothetical protein KKG92_13895, partial [Gammaproteobacteria bacterium]|nr:hypothetical protein [Gammaproteobacteria bacterium]